MDRPNRASSAILVVGILILAIGVFRAVQGSRAPSGTTSVGESTDSILARYEEQKKHAEKEPPAFEIGYAAVDLPVIERLLKPSPVGSANPELLSFPVTDDAVTSRLRIGKPPIAIDAGTIRKSVPDLKAFVAAYSSGQLKRTEISVACLIVKQLGKGKAASCEVDVDRIDLPGPVEMYDATDVGTEGIPSQIRRPNVPVKHDKIQMGPLDTGEGRVVPLLIMNTFMRSKPDGDPPGWQITSHTTYIPTKLRYTTVTGETKELPVVDALAQPINIR